MPFKGKFYIFQWLQPMKSNYYMCLAILWCIFGSKSYISTVRYIFEIVWRDDKITDQLKIYLELKVSLVFDNENFDLNGWMYCSPAPTSLLETTHQTVILKWIVLKTSL